MFGELCFWYMKAFLLQGVSYCQAVTVCAVISLLYLSRAVYNVIAVSPTSMPTFNFGWINVSDQVRDGYHKLHFL